MQVCKEIGISRSCSASLVPHVGGGSLILALMAALQTLLMSSATIRMAMAPTSMAMRKFSQTQPLGAPQVFYQIRHLNCF